MNRATEQQSDWQEALEANFGDYAYAPDGGMLVREENGTYTLRSGNPEQDPHTGLTLADVSAAINDLEMDPSGWSFE